MAEGDAPGTALGERVQGGADGPSASRRAPWWHVAGAAVALLAAYVALSFAMDPRGFLGTDTGGKVATLEVMVDRGDWDPDVGWWAAVADPEADLHGLYYTARVGDRYVNVTTLPLIYAARPLYAVGGYRAALLVPMAGAVAAALAARALARRLGADDRRAWLAYAVVGLASPLAVYALDLWEHTWGVALMAWGVVALVDAVGRRPTIGRGLLAGLAFGAGAAMRTESLVYGVVAVGATLVALAPATPAGWLGSAGEGRRWGDPVRVGAGALAGVAVGLVANAALEVAVLGQTFRAGRTGSAAARGGGALADRLEEAVQTGFNLEATDTTTAMATGVALAACLAFVAWRASRRGDQVPAQVAAAAAVALVGLRVLDGPGFVPGLVATTPFAVAGAVLAWRRPAGRLPAAIALAALPLVWLFQYRGGALPQWGGRYVLTSGLLLGAVGVARSGELRRWAQRLFVGLAVAITALGLVWTSQRTHDIADVLDDVEARPERVVATDVQFFLRELGAGYSEDVRWLVVAEPEDLDEVGAIAADEGGGLALLQVDGRRPPPEQVGPLVLQGVDEYTWLDVGFRIASYGAPGS